MAQVDLRSLRYFVAVAEERSMGRAAQRLHMAQPPLSVQIKNLEGVLGVALFRRGARGVELTDAGSALYARAREALVLAHDGVDAARAIGRGHKGRLVVGTMVVLSYPLLPQLATVLGERMPHVEIQYAEINAQNSIAAVLQADVNVALCMPPIMAPGVSSCSLGEEPLMVVLRQDSSLAALPAVPIAALEGMARIGLAVMGGDVDRSVVGALLREQGVAMPVAHRVETITTAMALVLAGLGCTLLPRCAGLGSPDGVVFRPLADVGASMDIAVCWRTDLGSELVEGFVRVAQEAFERQQRAA